VDLDFFYFLLFARMAAAAAATAAVAAGGDRAKTEYAGTVVIYSPYINKAKTLQEVIAPTSSSHPGHCECWLAGADWCTFHSGSAHTTKLGMRRSNSMGNFGGTYLTCSALIRHFGICDASAWYVLARDRFGWWYNALDWNYRLKSVRRECKPDKTMRKTDSKNFLARMHPCVELLVSWQVCRYLFPGEGLVEGENKGYSRDYEAQWPVSSSTPPTPDKFAKAISSASPPMTTSCQFFIW
jgi:hypothetical protein